MLRSTVLTVASAINYGVAMATTAFVIHVATGGILPVPATMGLVVAAGGIYAVCTAALVQRAEAERQPALATVTVMRSDRPQDRRRREAQPAMAFANRPSSISA